MKAVRLDGTGTETLVYYGGETSIPTRPRDFELRDALPLLVALVTLLVLV